jgi:hypothetical protein
VSRLIPIITSQDPFIRNQPLAAICDAADLTELLHEAGELDRFRRSSVNLYDRVRALFFLAAIFRYHLPSKLPADVTGRIPYEGRMHLLNRRFEEAISDFCQSLESDGPSEALTSALAEAYRNLGFQTLADQVRKSVRAIRGNQWMFRTGHVLDYPLTIRSELLELIDGRYPVLAESTPVRMDLSHSAWSDIFFLGMD